MNSLFKEFILTKQLTLDAMAQARAVVRNDKIMIEKIKYFLERASRHIFVQSGEFYGFLRDQHQGGSSALKMIDFFEMDLKELRVQLFTFSEKYLGDMPVRNTRVLILDFLALSRIVLERVNVEDSQLVPLLGSSTKVRCELN